MKKINQYLSYFNCLKLYVHKSFNVNISQTFYVINDHLYNYKQYRNVDVRAINIKTLTKKDKFEVLKIIG